MDKTEKLMFCDAMMLGLPEVYFTNSTWLEPLDEGLRHSGLPSTQKECMGCLVGGALYACGVRDTVGVIKAQSLIQEKWPYLANLSLMNTLCPVCRHEESPSAYPFLDFITDLASHYLWKTISMEEIYKIVRTIELAHLPKLNREETDESTNVAASVASADNLVVLSVAGGSNL